MSIFEVYHFYSCDLPLNFFHKLKKYETQYFLQNAKVTRRIDKDIVKHASELASDFLILLAIGLVLICCSRCGWNRLPVVFVVIVCTGVSVIVTKAAEEVSDLVRASGGIKSGRTGSGLIISGISGSVLTRSGLTRLGLTASGITGSLEL